MSTSRQTTESIMESVRAENPSFWPHGLAMNNFDTGKGEGVFLVRSKQANMEPVGFVGWQERQEKGEKIGYYSVGILPEHRGQGYAKEAVAKLINIKSGSVDKVIALIEKGNAPSQALAASIGVTIKSASVSGDLAKAILKRVGRSAGGAAAGAGMTYAANKATGADQWVNPQAERAQYMSTAMLGAMAAQPGAYTQLKRYVNPKQTVGGTSLLNNLLNPSGKVNPSTVRNLSLRKALSVASLPGVAYGTPLVIGSAHKPLAQVMEKDLPDMYAKELDRRGVTADEYPLAQFGIDTLGKSIGNRLEPTVNQLGEKAIGAGKELGDKALKSAEPILRENMEKFVNTGKDTLSALGEKAIEAGKPIAKEVGMAMVPGLVGSTVGSGLGWQAGKLFFQDDPTLGYEARTKRKNRQDNTKILLSLLGGTAGALAPNYKGLMDIIPSRFAQKTS